MQAPISGFFDAVDIILFILVIGGFLAVVADTGAIDAGIGSIVRKFSGRETLMIPILMLLFGLGGTIFGMAEETIAFYVLIIPIFIAAGFDAVTGFAVACVARLRPADGGSCMSDCLGRNKKGTGVSRAVASNALFSSVFSNGMRLVPAFAVASLSKIF